MQILSKEIQSDIARTAADLVLDERVRQIAEKGYSYDHDDAHGSEELASAAAFFLVPAFVNQDVCVCTAEYGLQVQSLHELIAENAYDGIHRDDYEDPGVRSDVAIDTRIGQLTKGLALGLAELERWMRAREMRDMEAKS
ncbi:MAG: hypothetical protein ACYCZD_12935 [Rhodanobacter sp.]